jgi:hypothetical protein
MGKHLRPSKKQRGSGADGRSLHWVASGKATASQVPKYKHTHTKTQTENAKGVYVREGGAVVHRRGKASSQNKSDTSKAKNPSPKAKANIPSPRAPSSQAASPVPSAQPDTGHKSPVSRARQTATPLRIGATGP